MLGNDRPSVAITLAGAALVGTVIGLGSLAMPRAIVADAISKAGVASGTTRQRAPQPGDHWGGCNDARAAGTAPIYRGEPGYRSDMDGDDDGIACEPHRF